MTNTLRFTQHALDRMIERNISKDEVRFVLKYGKATPATQWVKGPQRWIKREFIRGHEAKVVYAETPGWTEVITIMWVYEETTP